MKKEVKVISPINEHRFKIIIISELEFMNILRGKYRLINLPKDAEFYRCYYKPEILGFNIIIAHPSFSKTDHGEDLPRLYAKIEVI